MGVHFVILLLIFGERRILMLADAAVQCKLFSVDLSQEAGIHLCHGDDLAHPACATLRASTFTPQIEASPLSFPIADFSLPKSMCLMLVQCTVLPPRGYHLVTLSSFFAW